MSACLHSWQVMPGAIRKASLPSVRTNRDSPKPALARVNAPPLQSRSSPPRQYGLCHSAADRIVKWRFDGLRIGGCRRCGYAQFIMLSMRTEPTRCLLSRGSSEVGVMFHSKYLHAIASCCFHHQPSTYALKYVREMIVFIVGDGNACQRQIECFGLQCRNH